MATGEDVTRAAEMANAKDDRVANTLQTNVSIGECDPCRYAGVTSPAMEYCSRCDEYLCGACATAHRGSKLSRDHMILSGVYLPPSREPGVAKLAIEFCDDHTDAEIEWYCSDHDIMFCGDCKSTGHRKCRLKSISEMVEESKQDNPLPLIMESCKTLKTSLDKLVNVREKSADDLKRVSKSCEREVRQFKLKIMEVLERLETNIISEIKTAVTKEMDILSEHISVCKTLCRHVEKVATDAKAVLSDAEKPGYTIAAHRLAKSLRSIETTANEIHQETYTVNMEFFPDYDLDAMKDVKKLGILIVDSDAEIQPPNQTRVISKSLCDLKVSSSTTVNVPAGLISGSAFMSNGRLVLAYYDNSNKLILTEKDLNIKSKLKLSSRPWGIAVNGHNDVLVTMPNAKKVQYINVENTMTTGRAFKTSKKCWGIAVHNEDIYVSVHTNKGEGEVQVLDKRGRVIRRVGVDEEGRGTFLYPYYIAIGLQGTLYVSDTRAGDGRIVCFNREGNEERPIMPAAGKASGRISAGVLLDTNGNLLVCCASSKDVDIYKTDGRRHKRLFSLKGGPLSVCYRNDDATMVVTTLDKRSCHAYKLNEVSTCFNS